MEHLSRSGKVLMLPRTLLSVITVCLLAGCQSPFLVFPGGELEGQTQFTEDFAFAADHTLLQLEVDGAGKPYSVFLRTTVIDGELYVDAAPGRRWYQYLQVNPKVRIKLGDGIYDAVAVPVSEPAILERFLKGRSIYRMEPVRPGNAP